MTQNQTKNGENIESESQCEKENFLPTQSEINQNCQNTRDLEEKFVAPDGGWGWLVAVACGVSTLVTFPIMQQFGIIFRTRFKSLGISSPEMTTIINTQQAAATCTCLFNGPLFRRFSIRKVSLTGSVLIAAGLITSAFADSFIFYFLSIGIMYGLGRGLLFSSTMLVINIYFNAKRRTATSLQYTVAGLGPVVMPFLSTFLIDYYDVAGAVLIYAGISLHNFPSSFIFQPAEWHVKKSKKTQIEKKSEINDENYEPLSKPRSLMGSLSSLKSELSGYKQIVPQKTSKLNVDLANNDSKTKKAEISQNDHDQKKLSIWRRISIFLDLDLLKDSTYLNLVIGLDIIHFIELNFAFLTPFIMNEFGFKNDQIATAMSTLAISDVITRFSIPVITGRIKWDNKVFLLLAVAGMCIGRTIIVFNRDFTVVLIAFAFMGFVKAIRLVFWNLVIPSYAPLNKLAAAMGLQRMILGIMTLTGGPLIGVIRDATDYSFTVMCFNALCFIVIFSWIAEGYYRKLKQQRNNEKHKMKAKCEA